MAMKSAGGDSDQQLLQGVILTSSISCLPEESAVCNDNIYIRIDSLNPHYDLREDYENFSFLAKEKSGVGKNNHGLYPINHGVCQNNHRVCQSNQDMKAGNKLEESKNVEEGKKGEHCKKIGNALERKSVSKSSTVGRSVRGQSTVSMRETTKQGRGYVQTHTQKSIKEPGDKYRHSLLQFPDEDTFRYKQVGMLDQLADNLDRLMSLAVAEEYCKTKRVREQFDILLDQLNYSLADFEKYRLSMFTEIAELKRENRMLSDMVYRLAEKIVGLAEKGVEGYTGAQEGLSQQFQSAPKDSLNISESQQATITNRKGKSIFYEQSCIPQSAHKLFPYARAFSDSLDDIPVMKAIEEQYYVSSGNSNAYNLNSPIVNLNVNHPSINLNAFVELIHHFRMRVTCLNSHRDHETRNLETKMLSESLVGKLCKGPTLRSWIRHIDEGLDDLQRESLLERSAKDRTESMRRYAPITEKTVNQFLASLQGSIGSLSNNILAAKDAETMLLHIGSSAIITFLGILMQDYGQAGSNASESTNHLPNILLQHLQEIRMSAGCTLSSSALPYWTMLENFACEATALIHASKKESVSLQLSSV